MSPVRIGALLGVKDEIELIATAINHLKAIGVDDIVAYDMGSTDGTLETLQAMQSSDVTVVVLDDAEQMDGTGWARREMALIADITADWFIFLDADEFWIPQSGSLKTCRALTAADVLTVPRYNVPLGPVGPYFGPTLLPNHHDSLWLVTAPVPDFRVHLEAHPETPWSRGVPMPKVMARPHVIDRLTAGQHEVIARPPGVVRGSRPDDLLIAHFPFTTFRRFERKVRNIRQLLQSLPDFFVGHEAWHWKRWVRVEAEGRLEEEYKRQIFDQETFDRLRDTAVVRSARQLFGDNPDSSGLRAVSTHGPAIQT